jgi:hypothetical protein
LAVRCNIAAAKADRQPLAEARDKECLSYQMLPVGKLTHSYEFRCGPAGRIYQIGDSAFMRGAEKIQWRYLVSVFLSEKGTNL